MDMLFSMPLRGHKWIKGYDTRASVCVFAYTFSHMWNVVCYTDGLERIGYGEVFFYWCRFFPSNPTNQEVQLWLTSDIICLFSMFSCVPLLLCLPSPLPLFLPGVTEPHEVDATLALSVSLSTQNHTYSVQSKPLSPRGGGAKRSL